MRGCSFKIDLSIAPAYLPANVTFEPPQLQLVRNLPPPPPITTTIKARTRAVSAPQWTDLVQGIAAVEAEMEFRIDGPMTPGTGITLKCPGAVRQLRLTPGHFRSGEQTVRLWMRAVVPPSPARKSLVFQIIPPQPQGAVQIHAPDSVELVVSGPPPVQLVLTDGQRVPGTFLAVILDDATRARIRVVPAILGVKKPGEARGLVATPGSLPPIEIEGSPRIPLFTSGELTVKPAVTVRKSFFADTLVQGELTVLPAPLSDAVKGSRHGVLLRMEAPFKRLLFYLAVSISAILAVYLLFRLYMRLRTVESPDLPAGGDQ